MATLLKTAAPNDWKDVAIRAVKAFVFAFLSAATFDAFAGLDLGVLHDLILGAGAAGYGVVANALLTWSQSP